MSPELVMLGSSSEKADVWAVGATVFEMIDGKPPYFGKTTQQIFYAMGSNPRTPIPDKISKVSDEARGFLEECFRVSVDARPTSSELLRLPWLQK